MAIGSQGGSVLRVSRVAANAPTQGGAAIPVYGVTSIAAPLIGAGGAAVSVRLIADSELRINGGAYDVQGSVQAMVVTDAGASDVIQGDTFAIPVYVVNPSDWPNAVPPVIVGLITQASDSVITQAGDRRIIA